MNPYKNLYIKLTEPSDNPQTTFLRRRSLEIFMAVVESCPEMDFCALNFFTMGELNVARILTRKTWPEFLKHFTRKEIRQTHKLDFHIRKINERGAHFNPKAKMLKRQWKTQWKKLLAKLHELRAFTPEQGDRLLRMVLRNSGLGKYWHWTIKVGKKFTNRRENDESDYYCMKLLTG